jgi:hypothetical protein
MGLRAELFGGCSSSTQVTSEHLSEGEFVLAAQGRRPGESTTKLGPGVNESYGDVATASQSLSATRRVNEPDGAEKR